MIETVAGASTHFLFGPKGELLAEANASGQVQRSYIYLNGAPLAVVDSIGSVSYVLNDQVGQPQKMLSAVGALNWDRIAGIFGDTVAQPVGSSTTNPLRFPGQQYDAATALHYNYFRDYDPSLGRYIESDPVGLDGGINTYAYVGGNPARWFDGYGLDAARRDSTVYDLKTTPEQDAKALEFLRKYGDDTNLPGGFWDSVFGDNCSRRTNSALDAAGVPDPPLTDPVSGEDTTPPPYLPGSAGMRAFRDGATPINIPKGTSTVPPELQQFEPAK